MDYRSILKDHYSKKIQLAPTHIEAIASAIALRSPGCKLLVFGCGNDSAMWHALNKDGTTVFLESSPQWRDFVLNDHPQLDIQLYEPVPMSIEDFTVRSELLKSPLPEAMLRHKWDVILIDGPPGHSVEQPGRGVVMKWVSQVRTRSTHIFIDDYERPREKFYAEKFFKRREVITCPYRPGKQLAWSPGIDNGLMTGANLKKRGSKWKERKSAVLFLFDANYLVPFQVFIKTLEHAVATRKDVDLVVLTDDPKVYGDSFVNKIADRIIMLSDDDLKKISQTQGTAVHPSTKHTKYNKYTFLKFLVFNDFGYKEHIFLDVDMLCLDPNFEFDELLYEKIDFSAAPTIGHRHLGLSDILYSNGGYAYYDKEVRDKVMNTCLHLASAKKSIQRKINSGVMYIGGRLIGSNASSCLINEATRSAYPFEQDVIRIVIRETYGLRWKSMSIWYNFVSLPSYVMGEENFSILQKNIKFLHYDGMKPWKDKKENADWFQKLWWEAYDKTFMD
jgi:lipopolysaccharide biosynthesis glycosyltransferase